MSTCACKAIPISITVASTFRCADAGCVLSGPRRILEEQRGDLI